MSVFNMLDAVLIDHGRFCLDLTRLYKGGKLLQNGCIFFNGVLTRIAQCITVKKVHFLRMYTSYNASIICYCVSHTDSQ